MKDLLPSSGGLQNVLSSQVLHRYCGTSSFFDSIKASKLANAVCLGTAFSSFPLKTVKVIVVYCAFLEMLLIILCSFISCTLLKMSIFSRR